MEKMTQQDIVKDYLDKHGSISTLEASNKLFIMDLQGVIRSLKKKGMEIDYRWIYKRNCYGKRIRFKKYYLPNEGFFKRLLNMW